MGHPKKEIAAKDELSLVLLHPNRGANDIDKSFAVIGSKHHCSRAGCNTSEDGAYSSSESLERTSTPARKRRRTTRNEAKNLPHEPRIAEHDELVQSVTIPDSKIDPSPSAYRNWLLLKSENLQDRLDEGLQKFMGEMDGNHSPCMHLDPPAMSPPDAHAMDNEGSPNCSTGLDKQRLDSPPGLSLGDSISPVSSSASTPRGSSKKSPLVKRAQSTESETTDSERRVSPKFRRVDRYWSAADQKFTEVKPAAELGHRDAAQVENDIFVICRDLQHNRTHVKTTVEIKDSLLRQCLQNVMGNISGVNFAEDNPALDPKTLFLYLDDFRSHHELAEATLYNINGYWPKEKWYETFETRRCLGTLIEYLEQEFAEAKKNLDSMLSKGVITFDLSWALWKPSTLIYSPTYQYYDVPSVSVVSCTDKRKSQFSTDSKYSVDSIFVDFDGKTLAYKPLKREIQPFNGVVNITSLPFYPLQYHKDEVQIRRLLIDRGAKFVSLQGIHHKLFTGIAFRLVDGKNETMARSREEHSRIMIDPVGFRKVHPEIFKRKDLPNQYTNDDETFNDGVQPQSLMDLCTKMAADDQHNLASDVEMSNDSPSSSTTSPQREYTKKANLEMAKNNLLLICSPVIVGFSLTSLEWFEFDVRGIEDVNWNEEAWDSLVLDEKMKELIKASVASRVFNSAFGVNNQLPAKRKGLTMVLHGPPGTGKTLTVTGLSDHLRRPLLMLPARELMGCSAISVDSMLDKLLTTCQSWNAIVVFDDAQLLLEKNNYLGTERNNLVATISRHLESFQGIIFLTCNTIQIKAFEEAYQSRIDFVQKFEKPDRKGKSIILERAIRRLTAQDLWKTEAFSDEDYGKFVENNLSGRDIERAAELALSLAKARKEALGVRHLRDVLDMQEKFGCDFGKRDYRDYFS